MSKTLLRAGVGLAALIASAAPRAQSFDTASWLNQSVARATSEAAGWQVSNPVVQLADENYFMVAPNGTVLAGRRFLDKIAAEKDRDDLLNFVLLHEFRHIHQLQRKGDESRTALECEADFHAAFRLSSTTLDLSPDFDAAVGKVIAFQSIGPRLNRMADTSGHGHLTSDQRFLVGAFAGWRAIHQVLTRKGKLDEPRYAELAKRAKSFAEPPSDDDSAWASGFCKTMVTGANSERAKIDFRAKGTEFIEEGARVLFKESYEIRNTAEWPLRVTGWQVIGIRNKEKEDDLSLYMAGQANALDMLLQPGEAKTVTWLKTFPRTSSSMTLFDWSQPFMPQTVLAAVRAGPRAEQPNCQASWRAPADKGLAELFDFMLRAGNSASRQFVGIRGEQRPELLRSTTVFYDFAALPARVNRDQSYISMRKSGADPSASIGLLETEAPAEAERLFNEIADAFEGACGAKVLVRGRDKDGDLRLRVDRLTPLSSATMYVTKRDPRENGKPRYSVSWLVSPVDE